MTTENEPARRPDSDDSGIITTSVFARRVIKYSVSAVGMALLVFAAQFFKTWARNELTVTQVMTNLGVKTTESSDAGANTVTLARSTNGLCRVKIVSQDQRVSHAQFVLIASPAELDLMASGKFFLQLKSGKKQDASAVGAMEQGALSLFVRNVVNEPDKSDALGFLHEALTRFSKVSASPPMEKDFRGRHLTASYDPVEGQFMVAVETR